jgi:deoxyribodipyrimidine photo-lyase
MSRFDFHPSRAAALDRLAQFAPSAGLIYASSRNTDAGPNERDNVSLLSPYLRYRLMTEQDTVSRVLEQHSLSTAEKFIQEVMWRTYWKGWLQMRPSVWRRFCEERDRRRTEFHGHKQLSDAERGATGIEGFDDWAKELVETGYLHNHARMWFASIWIFTLRLPWTLGADFFLRHLLDADAASNTLSWRWVAGLQTLGKTYLATTDNIARYTKGRFNPRGLAHEAIALTEPPIEPARPLDQPLRPEPQQPSLLLITSEDMSPESLFGLDDRLVSAVASADADQLWGNRARLFVAHAADELAERISSSFNCPTQRINTLNVEALLKTAREANVQQIITPYAPVGAVADQLAVLAPMLAKENVSLIQIRREWDSRFWPHAKKGFFTFKEQIPALLRELALS